ncbi:unnamed protein product [Phytophthora fragariaefolia]|uniref:Unnamed protein product n=1 Tax=Phytophthora fragariaefolia TaxID=1490495 RepID=A0A9W7D1A2_9STRA|nr:unnamed protein product [Phytophthora fragariaefolia]
MTVVSSTEEAGATPGETVKTEVFRSEEADGSIVTKTVRTTTRTETFPAGELVTTIEVETIVETEVPTAQASGATAMSKTSDDEPNWFMSLFTGKPKEGDKDKPATQDSIPSPHRQKDVASTTTNPWKTLT